MYVYRNNCDSAAFGLIEFRPRGCGTNNCQDSSIQGAVFWCRPYVKILNAEISGKGSFTLDMYRSNVCNDLLQENSTLQRLKDEKGVLEGSVNYLRARLAVESAFTTDSSSEESAGSEGSPEGPEVTPEQ